MMFIQIASKIRPFSHLAGTECLLPGSGYSLTIYPQKIVIKSLKGEVVVSNNISGLVEGFTVELDLEAGRVLVWGISTKGYFRYSIRALKQGEGLVIQTLKAPEGSMSWTKTCQSGTTSEIEIVLLDGGAEQQQELFIPENLEGLHLGVSKKQDWELVLRRNVLEEILPFWFALGQQVPKFSAGSKSSIYTSLKEAVEANRKEEATSLFMQLFRTGFRGMLNPQLEDKLYQGHPLKPVDAENSLAIASEGSAMIRALFVKHVDNEVQILPFLLPQLSSGRMTNIQLKGLGVMDIEWTKKCVRRAVLRATHDSAPRFQFQKELKRYRIRHSKKNTGIAMTCGDTLTLRKDGLYLFDNFQK